MKVFFVKPIQAEPARLPFANLELVINWQRPMAVAVAAGLTALLHGLLFLWYLNRPEPPAITDAMPLPMIDIALAAPAVNVSATPPKPVEPPKPKPAEKKIKPKVKPKPVPKPKAESEIKKKLEKFETKVEEAAPPPPPATAPVTPTQSKVEASPAVKDVPAHANADYLNNPKPKYPRIAEQRHWEGMVVLRVFVTEDGRCGELSVLRGSGHEVLDEAALEAVKGWRFVPGKHGDKAVASWVNVPIDFTLD